MRIWLLIAIIFINACASIKNKQNTAEVKYSQSYDGRCERIHRFNGGDVSGTRTYYASDRLWQNVINNRLKFITGRHDLLNPPSQKVKELIARKQVVAINPADVSPQILADVIAICQTMRDAPGDIDRNMYDAIKGFKPTVKALVTDINNIIRHQVIGSVVRFRFGDPSATENPVYEFAVMDVFTAHGMAYDLGLISRNNNLGVREANDFIGDFNKSWLLDNNIPLQATLLLQDVVVPITVPVLIPKVDDSSNAQTTVPAPVAVPSKRPATSVEPPEVDASSVIYPFNNQCGHGNDSIRIKCVEQHMNDQTCNPKDKNDVDNLPQGCICQGWIIKQFCGV